MIPAPLRRRFPLLGIVLTPMLAFAAPMTEENGSDEVLVGEVIILGKEVFNPSVPGYDRFPFSWLNALHVKTRRDVIREAILFHEGDSYDPEVLEETERNLRALSFINFASVVPGERRGNVQDVVVETHDIWSTQLSVALEKGESGAEGGGELDIRLEEQNVLGRGKRFEVSYHRTGDDDGFGWLYADPLVLGRRWTARAYRRDLDDGKEWGADFRRPFYSLDARWGGGGRIIYDSRDDRVFRRDREIGRFVREFRWESAGVSRMLGDRYRKLLIGAEIVRERRTHDDLRFPEDAEPDTTILPGSEDLGHLPLSVRLGRFRFVEESRIDYFDQVEDIELGGFGALSFGPVWRSAARWRLATETHFGFSAGPGRYTFLSARLTSERHDEEWRRTVLSSDAKYYHRWSPRNTFVARFLWEEAWKVEAGREYFVDGSNGMRGYEGRSDIGQRRMVLNLENRVFSDLQWLTVAFGGALFFDVGAAWDRDEPVRAEDLHSTAGLGLRLGLMKIREAKAIRIDVARDLRRGTLLLEVDLGHLFLTGRPFGDFVRSSGP
ncbi:MAG: BamA/TamA family outer membrane protein [Candidatus Eisenbacteria bacterium]